MPDVPTPSSDALSHHLHGDGLPIRQPETYLSAHKNADLATAWADCIQSNTTTPRGWMQPAENFSPEGGIVLAATRLPATPQPISFAPALVATSALEIPDLPICTTWASHDGTSRGTVQRHRWGIGLMVTTGVSGCRATSSLTLQPFSARLLAHVMQAAHAAALAGRDERYSLAWGDPGDLHGRVTLHRFGIDVTATAGTAGDSVTTTVQFRATDVVAEVSRLLFAQSDAFDAESSDEGDVA